MTIRYRFLDRIDREGVRTVDSVVFSGFFSPEFGPAHCISQKSIKEKVLDATIDNMDVSNIVEYESTEYRYELTSIKTIKISDSDDEWTPDDLLDGREMELRQLNIQQRKTA